MYFKWKENISGQEQKESNAKKVENICVNVSGA